MKKIFLFAKHVKTSDDCDRFSKSVSYETLVGGTTTECSADEQARCLSKGGADAPLTAVGTFSAAPRAASKVVENLLHRHSEPQAKNPEKTKTVIPDLIGYLSRIKKRKALSLRGGLMSDEAIFQAVLKMVQRLLSRCRKNVEDCRVSAMHFLAMTPATIALAAVLSLCVASESRAKCSRPTNGVCKTLEETGNCGTGCSYTYDSATQTVNITATGEKAIIGYTAFHRLYYEDDIMSARNFVINGAVALGDTAIVGGYPFTISGADGALVLTALGQAPVGENGVISGTIIIPEGATFKDNAFHGKFADDAKIYCNIENCEQKMIASCGGDLTSTKCKTVNKIIRDGQLYPFPDGCAVMGSTGCNKCKSSSFRLNDGECDRIRYTPAEAAEVLKDTDNEIIMTFKVNR